MAGDALQRAAEAAAAEARCRGRAAKARLRTLFCRLLGYCTATNKSCSSSATCSDTTAYGVSVHVSMCCRQPGKPSGRSRRPPRHSRTPTRLGRCNDGRQTWNKPSPERAAALAAVLLVLLTSGQRATRDLSLSGASVIPTCAVLQHPAALRRALCQLDRTRTGRSRRRQGWRRRLLTPQRTGPSCPAGWPRRRCVTLKGARLTPSEPHGGDEQSQAGIVEHWHCPQ